MSSTKNIKIGHGIMEKKCPLCPPNVIWLVYLNQFGSCTLCFKQLCEEHLLFDIKHCRHYCSNCFEIQKSTETPKIKYCQSKI